MSCLVLSARSEQERNGSDFALDGAVNDSANESPLHAVSSVWTVLSDPVLTSVSYTHSIQRENEQLCRMPWLSTLDVSALDCELKLRLKLAFTNSG